jgi:hypothetical protein
MAAVSWAIILIVMASIVGVGLLYAGRKRRIGTSPHCRKCNYLLHGLESHRCPECGAVLAPAAIVHGERRRRRAASVAGWLILLLPWSLYLTASLRHVNWYHYKPTYFVMRDLNSGQSQAPLTAWQELMRRDAKGSLSASTRNDLVNFALAGQSAAVGTGSVMDVLVINYLGSRWKAGDLPQGQKTRFFQQILRLRLAVRSKVIAGDTVPYVVFWNGFGPHNGYLWMKSSMMRADIDGKWAQGPPGPWDSHRPSSFSGMGPFSSGSEAACPPTLGLHNMSFTARVEVFNRPLDHPGETLVYRDERTMRGSFEVLPTQPANFIQAIVDPSAAPAIVPGSFVFSAKDHFILGDLQVTSVPANLAFDVFLRYGGTEHWLENWTCRAHYQPQYGVGGDISTTPPEMVDVILRPSEKAARETLDLYSYWNRELVFPNIRVFRRQP